MMWRVPVFPGRNVSTCASLNQSCGVEFGRGVSARETGGHRRKGALPGFIEPALATSIERVPNGTRWIHEIKFDGYRVQVHLINGAVKIFTRRGNDWTRRFRKVADDAWHIPAGSAIIDGEIVVPAADGTTDFSVLQNELKGKSKNIVMVAFDLLYLNGYDLRKLPLIERKALLKKTISGTDIQFSESFEIDGRQMFAHACKVGLEGVVSKVRDNVKMNADRWPDDVRISDVEPLFTCTACGKKGGDIRSDPSTYLKPAKYR
jgi:ATP-dependent DNA ligase